MFVAIYCIDRFGVKVNLGAWELPIGKCDGSVEVNREQLNWILSRC